MRILFFAFLILSPLVAQASPPAFDYEQWRRDHPRPAGKRLDNLNVGEPRTVRMIYFLPNDRPYRAEAVDSMKTNMRQAQDFFIRQMRVHRLGNLTLRVETDAQGEPLVHRVNGQHSTSYYNAHYTVKNVLDEVNRAFDIDANIYYIAIDHGKDVIYSGKTRSGGGGYWTTKNGGWFLVPISADFTTVAHELGHAFGLLHDFRDADYIMSYGRGGLGQSSLSVCNAELLAVHPYFNFNSPLGERWSPTSPTIEERTSSPIHHTADATSIPVRIRAQDPDGLHQAILFTETQAPHSAAGSLEVKACRGLEGERDAVVEFAYDGTVPSTKGSDLSSFKTQWLWIQAIDALGNIAFSDGFELVNNEFREPLSTFFVPHSKSLSPVLYPPDGRLLALESSREDAKVRLRDLSMGKYIANLSSRGPVETVALSPDGRLLALESADGAFELWDVLSKALVASIPLPHGKDENNSSVVSSLSFSPNGRLLASGGSYDSLVKLWDVSSRQHVATLPKAHGGTILSIVFSLDGKVLAASGSGGTIALWDVASREPVTTISAHARGVQGGLSLSPDGRLLASAGRKWVHRFVEEVKVWDVASGQHIATFLGSAPVSFSPDGRLLASAWSDVDGLEGGIRQGATAGGKMVRLWDVATGRPIASITPGYRTASLTPESRVRRVGFSLDGRLLVEESYKWVRLWDVSEWTDAQTITAVEQARPHRLTKISGDGQEGPADTQLAQPFVVSVLDQNGAPLAGTVVIFSVTAGEGTLSATTAITDANGRAASWLTLGLEPGTNAVEATVEGLEPVTFAATGQESLLSIFLSGQLDALPNRTHLLQNAPNPFNSQTTLSYFLHTPGPVRLEVFALSGQRIAILHQGPQPAGYHRLSWDSRDAAGQPVASGMYLYRLVTAEDVLTRKLILLR